MDGFLVIDKPAGCTSHDIVNKIRRAVGVRKVGHTGTLDPFATGVLPIAVGEGTKAIPFLDEAYKEYRAVMRIGSTTDTGDLTGRVTGEFAWQTVTEERVREAATAFVGRIRQLPPMYSAVKRNGVPLYKAARRGQIVEREPRVVTIEFLSVEEVVLPDITFSVRCSRGTYVRALATDWGELLGCGSHLRELRRTVSGRFRIDDAIPIARLPDLVNSGTFCHNLMSINEALDHLPELRLTVAGEERVRNGGQPGVDGLEGAVTSRSDGPFVVRLSREGRLVAVAELVTNPIEGKNLRLLRVFNELSPLHGQPFVVKDTLP